MLPRYLFVVELDSFALEQPPLLGVFHSAVLVDHAVPAVGLIPLYRTYPGAC